MAQFRATIQGSRGEASRLGTKKDGITAEVNGWNGGVSVSAHVTTDAEGKEIDKFFISITGGSDGTGRAKTLGTVAVEDGVAMWFPLARGKIKL